MSATLLCLAPGAHPKSGSWLFPELAGFWFVASVSKRGWFSGGRFATLFPILLILFMGSGRAGAQTTRIWDGGSSLSSDWSTSFLGLNGYNWNPNANPVAGDHLTFSGSNRTTNNNNYTAGTAFGDISFAGGAAAFTLGGNSITLNGSVTNNSANTQTINLSFNLPGVRTFNAASGNLIQNGALSGSGGLVKAGSNVLTLSNISNSYTGTTTVNAGTLRAGSTQAFGVNSAVSIAPSSGAVLDLNGFSNSVGSLSGGGSVALGNATLTVGGDNSSTTFAGDISGANGSLTKVGAGTLILTASNSYEGLTAVSAGTLLIQGNQSAANGSVSVASGGTLGGSGVVGDASSSAVIGSGGTLTGGADGNGSTSALQGTISTPEADAVGTLSFGGDLTVQNGSVWLVDLVQGMAPHGDRIDVGGNLEVVSGAELNFNFAGTFQLGNSYTIAQYASLGDGLGGGNRFNFAGSIWEDNTERTLGGGQYLINYGAGTEFNQITLTAVPEPATFALLGIAIAGLLIHRIRQRRAEAAIEKPGPGAS